MTYYRNFKKTKKPPKDVERLNGNFFPEDKSFVGENFIITGVKIAKIFLLYENIFLL